MTINEGVELFKNNPSSILLDVRTKEEYEKGHISGSINIPLDSLFIILNKVLDKNKTIYVYCRSGRKSKIGEDYLKSIGYINAINIGGILDFKGEIKK